MDASFLAATLFSLTVKTNKPISTLGFVIFL
jgi:hypothetical protein